jgi:hypothetical protein
MSLPAQTQAQKLKPLFIALGVIGALIVLIVGAPHVVRAISG